jgi:sugar lactone lactonase YvrE
MDVRTPVCVLDGWKSIDNTRVCRYSPDGELLGVVEVPTPLVTSCAFGGLTLDDLYITTASRDLDRIPAGAGDLYVARTGVSGHNPADSEADDTPLVLYLRV